LAELQLRQGTLLEYNHVHMAERDWDPEAKLGARRIARARSQALDAFSFDPVHHEPEAIVPRQAGPTPFEDAPDLLELPNEMTPSADVSRVERRLPPRDAETGSVTGVPKLPPATSTRQE
jgi:hypothetical protein